MIISIMEGIGLSSQGAAVVSYKRENVREVVRNAYMQIYMIRTACRS